MTKLLLSALFILSIISTSIAATGSSCNCWLTRDSTWSVVAFDGSGGSGGPGLPPDYRNDDWSSDTIGLPFIFCFYGDTITEVYINNNGNISFGSPYSTFTANSFPDSTYSMIAPLWSDVDTRGALSGVVYYKVFSGGLVVQWDHVGYFDSYDDKLNTYQLIITDGNSNLLPEQKNVGFCYKDMQWTTGDASGGSGGFGGTPATAGVNFGDGINYIQLGLYDNNTFAYDGPFGNNDGVLSLSNQSFIFNVCVSNFNVPPILSGDFICDTIQLCLGDTFVYEADFLSPEQTQITSVSIDAHGLSGVNLVTSPGNPANVQVSMVAASVGYYIVDVIGTDNGSPAGTTVYSLLMDITNCTVGIDEKEINTLMPYPNPVHDHLTLDLSNASNRIRISTPEGLIIYEGFSSGKTTINTSDWPGGIYFVNVQSEKQQSTVKILKN